MFVNGNVPGEQSFVKQSIRVLYQGLCLLPKNGSVEPHCYIEQSLYVTREWVSSATVMWMIKELIENDAAHPDLTQVIYIYFVLIV